MQPKFDQNSKKIEILDKMDWSKKPSHASVPLTGSSANFVGRRNVWCRSPPCRRKTPPCFASITTVAACITTTITQSIIRRWASAIRLFRRRRFTATRRHRRHPHRWTAAVPGSRFHRRRLPAEFRRITSCRSTAQPPRYKEWHVQYTDKKNQNFPHI